MKLSVSVSAEDVVLLDQYALVAGLPSRSAAVQHAIRLLRHLDLEQDYAAAWADWELSGERAALEARSATGCRMRRGEVFLVDLDPARSQEADQRRPAVVVSN